MRLGYLLVGLALGVGATLYRNGRLPLPALGTLGTAGERTTTQTRTRPSRQATAERQPASPVEGMVDEVVHHQDIPETPVKQAFEAALEHQHPHGP